MVPTVEFPPVTPLTLQVTVVFDDPVTVEPNCWVVAIASVAVAGETMTETPLTTVTMAWADVVVSATLVATTVTFAGEGMAAGAV
jgi:hypothetical protein